MSRNRKQQSTVTPSTGNNSLPGNLTLSLGPKGIHISGQGIQPERMTFKPRQQQQQQQQQPQQGWSPGSGGSEIATAMQNCLLAATSASLIQQRQFNLHQEAQANSEMLVTALRQVASSMGVTPATGTSSGKKKRYRAPQQQFQGQQKQASGQDQQQHQQQRQKQYAGV